MLRPAAGSALVAMLCALSLLSPAASGGRPAERSPARAGVATSFLTGIGDEHTAMFANPLYVGLHTQIARYIAPYDAAVHPYFLQQAARWIAAAEGDHQQVLVAFYHSEYTPTKLPSVATYTADVAKFVKLFPNVRQYQAYDEANRGNSPPRFASPSAKLAAQYYQALAGVCAGCTVVGLDVLDGKNIRPTLRYISAFKREVRRLRAPMPSIWGLHNYSDVNHFQTWRTRALVRALDGQVWLTETGGIVRFAGAFGDRHGAGLRRAARALKLMFAIAASEPRITRLYIYDWTGGDSGAAFDAGLMDTHEVPRPGYVVVCRALHALSCGVRIASD